MKFNIKIRDEMQKQDFINLSDTLIEKLKIIGKSKKKIEIYCNEINEVMAAEFKNLNYRHKKYTEIRNKIRENFKDHPALKHLKLSDKELLIRNKEIEKTRDRNKLENQQTIDVEALIERCATLIKGKSYSSILPGLIGLTGRRPIELLERSEYKIKDYKTLLVKGIAKKTQKNDNLEEEIECLYDSTEILNAIEHLREITNIKEISEREERTNRIKSIEETARKFAVRHLKSILPEDTEKKVNSRFLREAYSAVIVSKRSIKEPKRNELSIRKDAINHESFSATMHYTGTKSLELTLGVNKKTLAIAKEIQSYSDKNSHSFISYIFKKALDLEYEHYKEFLNLKDDDKIKTTSRKNYLFKYLFAIKKIMNENKEEKNSEKRTYIDTNEISKLFKLPNKEYIDLSIKIMEEVIKEHHENLGVPAPRATGSLREYHDIYSRAYKTIINQLKSNTPIKIDESFYKEKTELKTKERIEYFTEKFPQLEVRIHEYNFTIEKQ